MLQRVAKIVEVEYQECQAQSNCRLTMKPSWGRLFQLVILRSKSELLALYLGHIQAGMLL